MHKDKQKYLKYMFPIFYSQSNTVNPWAAEKPFGPIEGFGIECGDGWYKLIYEVSKVIEEYNNTLKPKNKLYKVYIWLAKKIMRLFKLYRFPFMPKAFVRATQIKEKYGILTIYVDNYIDSVDRVLTTAEELSATICEQCGKPGKLREVNGWYFTACDYHTEHRRS